MSLLCIQKQTPEIISILFPDLQFEKMSLRDLEQKLEKEKLANTLNLI